MDAFMENNGNGGLQAAVSDRIIDRDDLAPIESLPRELLYDIMSYLSTLDICRLMETSYSMWHSVLPQLVEVEEQSSNFLLGWATYNGHHRLMKSIIETARSKLDFSEIINRSIVCTFLPTIKNKVLETFPIHLAVMKNDAEAFKILAPITTNAHCKDSDGRTLLHYSRVHAEITETALRWGLEPDEGDSPKPHKSLTALQRVLTYNERRLIGPVGKTTLAIVKTMLTQGNANPHKFVDQNRSPLCLAFQHSPEMVKILLENGADPNFRSLRDTSSNSETALVIAAGLPDGSEIVRLLVEHGADVDGISGDTSPLMNAIQHGRVRSAEILLDAGANPNIYLTDSNYGKSPLVLYMRQGAWSSVEALVSKGANLNFPPLNPLTYAAQFLLLQDVEKVLELGATPNPCSTSPGRSPYVSALCLRRRGELHRRNEPEDHDAFEKERSAILDLLLGDGLELHTEDMSIEFSPLFQTLERGGVKELTRLLKDGANANAIVQFRGFPGCTPLHYTLPRSEFKTDILLENGADPLSGYSETLGARDTPLRRMIWKREVAWSWEVWFRVIHFLGHEKAGMRVTENFDKDTLAVLLFHVVVACRNYTTEDNIRRFARLTNFGNRWGSDGISGILELIHLPAYWRRSVYVAGPPTSVYAAVNMATQKFVLLDPQIVRQIQCHGAMLVARMCAGGENMDVRKLLMNNLGEQPTPSSQHAVSENEQHPALGSNVDEET